MQYIYMRILCGVALLSLEAPRCFQKASAAQLNDRTLLHKYTLVWSTSIHACVAFDNDISHIYTARRDRP